MYPGVLFDVYFGAHRYGIIAVDAKLNVFLGFNYAYPNNRLERLPTEACVFAIDSDQDDDSEDEVEI